MRARAYRLALTAGLAVSFAGCSLGPDYRRPELAVPEAFRAESQAADTTAGPAVAGDWWSGFGDPELDRLIALALEDSADLRIAAARVEEARALAGVERSRRFPLVTASGSAGRSRISEETTPLPPGGSSENTRLAVSAAAELEIDLWGRMRRQTEAAVADLLATSYGADALRLSLVSSIARAWFELRTLDRQLAIAGDTRGSREEALELQEQRYDAGVISGLELEQARAELATARAAAQELERDAATAESRLAVLIGGNPRPLPRGGDLAAFAVPPPVPPGLPSSLLARRPDIAAAEQRLVAANARIGVAKAAYFPALSLTGSYGSESKELSGLLSTPATVWQAAATLFAPIFAAGRAGHEVDAARARQVQALEEYRRTVQGAFADVEIALVARRTEAARRAAIEDRVRALVEVLDIARVRYEGGQSSYLEVLDAQRSLFQAELDLAAATREELGAAATLFEALGGGWEAP